MSAPEVTAATVPTRDHPEVGWLLDLTNASRPVYSTPWTVLVGGKSHTVATDGRVMVAREGDYGFPIADADTASSILGVLDAPSMSAPQTVSLGALRAFAGVPAHREPCEHCNSTGSIACDECEGEGVFECDGACSCCDRECDGEVSCKNCRGTGSVDCDAEGCVWKDGPECKPVIIGIGRFDAALVRTVLANLPGHTATWQQDQPERLARLHAEPWTFIWMPLRQLDGPTQDDGTPRIGFVDAESSAVTP